VKTLVETRQIEMGHARALLALPAARQQSEVALLSRRRGCRCARPSTGAPAHHATGAAGESAPPRRDPDVARLEQDLTDKLGARVQLQQGAKGRGRLVIAYNSLDELDGILAHIR